MSIIVPREPTDSSVLLEKENAHEDDYYLTVSIVMAVLCYFFGGWPSVIISTVAICISRCVSLGVQN